MAHRALADIRESIRELAYYRAAIFVPPPGPSAEAAGALAAGFVTATPAVPPETAPPTSAVG
jgi:oligoribonuclease